MDLFKLTRKLIDIPSVTGAEAEVGGFLDKYLRALGYQVELHEVAAARSNLIATTGAAPRVVLSTHLDTVPPYIASSEDADYLHGRGSCDAKGIIAAQIMAAERLRAGGVNEIGLLFTVDEELSSKGAQAVNAHPLASECRYLINGEPTDNKLAVGTKGSLGLKLTTDGRAAHSAYPEQGESAIEAMLDVLESIRRCTWPRDDFFGETTCNIGVIAGGSRANVIPPAASAELQLRLVTDVAGIKKMIETAVAGRATIEYRSAHAPMRLVAVDGFEQSVVRFTTDIPYLSNWGQALLIGPGSILDAHTAHERVSKSELERGVDLYSQLVRALIERDAMLDRNSREQEAR